LGRGRSQALSFVSSSSTSVFMFWSLSRFVQWNCSIVCNCASGKNGIKNMFRHVPDYNVLLVEYCYFKVIHKVGYEYEVVWRSGKVYLNLSAKTSLSIFVDES
jgi:predicted membrane protein